MSPKAMQPVNPDQAPLFSLEELAPNVPGPAVDVHERAQHLLGTLDLISEARQREGFGIAANPDSRHRPPIERAYGRNLGQVRRGAERNREQLMFDAKWQFAYATGHMALKNSGLVSETEAKRMSGEDFDNFMLDYYTGANAEKKRRQFRRQLQRQTERR